MNGRLTFLISNLKYKLPKTSFLRVLCKMLPLRPVIRFLTTPLFILTIIYCFFLLFLQIFGKRLGSSHELREYTLSTESCFFILGWNFWIFSIPFDWYDFPPYLTFLIMIVATSRLNIGNKLKPFFFGFFSSILIGTLLSLLLQPLYKQDFSLYLYLPNVTVSGLTYTTVLISLIFFLSGFLWMTYSNFWVSIFKKTEKTSFTLLQLIISHIQLIPLFLFPLFIVQIVGSSQLLEPIVIILFNFSTTLLFLIPYCLILSLLGEKIIKLRFLWITSIFSLISFCNAIFVAFQFIAFNLEVGAFALGVIISWLLCCSIGIILARYLNSP